MNKTVTRRKYIRRISFLSAVTAVLAAVSVLSVCRLNELKKSDENEKLLALVRLSESAGTLEEKVLNCAFSSSPVILAEGAADIKAAITAVKDNLTLFDGEKTEELTDYYDEFGEEVQSAVRIILSGEDDIEERSKLTELAGMAETAARAFSTAALTAMEGGCDLGGVKSPFEGENGLPACEELFPDVPIPEEKAVSGSAEPAFACVTRSEAAGTAAEYLGIEPCLLRDAKRCESSGCAYLFHHGEDYVGIDGVSGRVALFLTSCGTGAGLLSEGDARERAAEVLRSLGYPELDCVSSAEENGSRVFAFAPEQGETVLLCEEISVGVCLSDGKTVSFDARDYLSGDGRVPRAELTPEKAGAALPEGFDWECGGLFYEKTENGKRLYYHFVCSYDGFSAQAKVNAVTGIHEKIRVQKREHE